MMLCRLPKASPSHLHHAKLLIPHAGHSILEPEVLSSAGFTPFGTEIWTEPGKRRISKRVRCYGTDSGEAPRRTSTSSSSSSSVAQKGKYRRGLGLKPEEAKKQQSRGSGSGSGHTESLQKFFATCAPGLEDVLVAELSSPLIGALQIEPGSAGVSFMGTRTTGYKANLWLRTAVRVLVELASGPLSFRRGKFDPVYEFMRDAVDWPSILVADDQPPPQASAGVVQGLGFIIFASKP